MNTTNKQQNQPSSCIHCVIDPSRLDNLASCWKEYLFQQTLQLSYAEEKNCFYLSYANLTDETPSENSTLLEQMAWVLLSHEDCDVVVWPLFNSIKSQKPLSLLKSDTQTARAIQQQGFISLSRISSVNLSDHNPHRTLFFSLALLGESNAKIFETHSNLLQQLKNKIPLKQKIFLKHKADALRNLLTIRQSNTTSLARATSWSAQFIRPQLALNKDNINIQDRIPVLIAMHWLELGGAEKFAVDLIKQLPKEEYAIYVTTDITSFNPWSIELAEHVESIFHLPTFLPIHRMSAFYEYIIRTRQIRLMHIHHGAQAYESLYHIRRFHPQLRILDSLHIIELPPSNGGYVETSAQKFESFIDHHHVISHHVKSFLMQRWLIPEEKISVIYLNVDSDYFDPEIIEKGQTRRTLNISKNACLVGFIGRFSQQKRPLEFIKTAQLLQRRWEETSQSNPLVFLMTGGGLLEHKIKHAIEKLSNTKVLLQDQVEDTRPVYQDCDVLMMTSENEGLALVSYEAMAMQTPIFFTNVGAQAELLQPNFLIENKPPIAEKFSDAMWPYLIDSERRQQTGIKMRGYIRKHHHHEQTYTQLTALYRQLLAQVPGFKYTET